MVFNVGNRIMNTYVFNTKLVYVMVDTGYENSLKSVEKKLNKLGISILDIKYLFLTHAHDDHAGFLNELLTKNQALKVIINEKSIKTLKKGQNSFNGGCSTFFAWVFCKLMALWGKGEHRFPPIEERFFNRFIVINNQNKTQLESLLEGEILFTPGHTEDSISLVKENIVFCGDTAMNGIPSSKRCIIWVENVNELKTSWELLINSKAEIIYPAHGKPFSKKDLVKYINSISKIKLRKLK